MTDDLPAEELSAALDAVVADLLAAAGVGGPPVDALALAERHVGFVIRREPGGGRSRRRAAGPVTVAVDPDAALEAQQWAAARAIGAHLAPEVVRRLGLDPDAARRAGLGTPLAGRVLVPTAWFAADAAACDYDLLSLKERYATAGYELLADRWLDLPEPCVVTVLDDGRVMRRRSNARRVNKRPSSAEERCGRLVTSSGRPRTVLLGGCSVRGWPVPTPHGPRVILRSTVDEDALGEQAND
ncbi:MAG TPA: hypothetical protein VGF55_17140 [Gemmataceae bacterium]|jgi:hypothetical protein